MKTKKEIIEGNKLIADFMGKKRKYESTEKIFRENLDYNFSWDSLMPVCIKINSKESIKYCESNGVKDSVICYINALVLMKRGVIRFDIEKTWNGVIAFIKWHNQTAVAVTPINTKTNDC